MIAEYRAEQGPNVKSSPGVSPIRGRGRLFRNLGLIGLGLSLMVWSGVDMVNRNNAVDRAVDEAEQLSPALMHPALSRTQANRMVDLFTSQMGVWLRENNLQEIQKWVNAPDSAFPEALRLRKLYAEQDMNRSQLRQRIKSKMGGDIGLEPNRATSEFILLVGGAVMTLWGAGSAMWPRRRVAASG